jgi:DNA-binding winged helix-turn-helix (wHTH) protein
MESAIYRFGSFELDLALFELRGKGSKRTLPRRSFALLKYLVEHHDRVVTKEELLAEVWPDAVVAPGVVPTYVKRIRRALGQSAGADTPIRTYHGRGYRLTVPVIRIDRRSTATARQSA